MGTRSPDKPSKRGAGLINRLDRAAQEVAFSGAQHPEDRPAIDEEYKRAKFMLRMYVAGLELLADYIIEGEKPPGELAAMARRVRGISPKQGKDA